MITNFLCKLVMPPTHLHNRNQSHTTYNPTHEIPDVHPVRPPHPANARSRCAHILMTSQLCSTSLLMPSDARNGKRPYSYAAYNSTHGIPDIHSMRRPHSFNTQSRRAPMPMTTQLRSPSCPMPPTHLFDGERPYSHAT